MSGNYRIELASTGRAGCCQTTCKKENSKIGKGELRQGVTVMINEHTSLKWRHWGCVTPLILHNWKETSGGDMELIDGYEELPADAQEKVERALQQGHVDDEDWNGDMELNRFENNPKGGLFFTAAQKKAKAKEEGADANENAPKKKDTKKRKQTDDEGEADGKPALKKRGKKVKAEQDDDEAPPDEAPPAKAPAKRGKKVKAEQDEDETRPPKMAKAPARKAARKAAPVKVEQSSEDEEPEDELEEDDEPAPKPAAKAKKAKGKAAKTSDAETKPQRKGRARKATVEEED